MRPIGALLGRLHRLVPVALCALGAHTALYRSLLPATGAHAYLSWYEPLVAGLSLAAVLVFAAVGLAALAGRGRPGTAILRLVLPAAPRPEKVAARARRLALSSLAFLAVQESIERMLSHAAWLASFGAGEILIVLAALTLLAWLIALVERSLVQLIVCGHDRVPTSRSRSAPSSIAPARPRSFRNRNPLAERRGLRAPPLPA